MAHEKLYHVISVIRRLYSAIVGLSGTGTNV